MKKKVLVIAPAAAHERFKVERVRTDTPEFKEWMARVRMKQAAALRAAAAESARRNMAAWEGF